MPCLSMTTHGGLWLNMVFLRLLRMRTNTLIWVGVSTYIISLLFAQGVSAQVSWVFLGISGACLLALFFRSLRAVILTLRGR